MSDVVTPEVILPRVPIISRYTPSPSEVAAAVHAEQCGHCHLIPAASLTRDPFTGGRATDHLVVCLTPVWGRETRPGGVLG